MQSCDMCLSISKTMKIFTKMDGSRQLSECSCLDPSKIDYLTCGAFDCIFSDSPWQLFARLIGKWREFRPSSSWVFGSWEVGNSGSRDSKVFEIPKYKNIQRATIWNTIDSEVGVLGMYESFDKILSLDQKLSGIEKTVGNRKSLEGCYRWMELRSSSDVLNLTPKIYEEWIWYSYSHGVGLLASMEMPTFQL